MEQRKLGKYVIRTVLGRGAAGVVYEGWDPAIARRVAIKTVKLPGDADDEMTEMLARCKREAQAAGGLNHPSIVGVFDYGETDEVAYIVMEFIDGRTLKSVLDSGEGLPLAEIVRVMTALLTGLQYSHDNGVVHRDIKPANIMLTIHGQVKIADFGIARIESSNMTQVGTVLGSPAYMSPEQFMGHTADRRSDIYSAGVLLYQMLTGQRPFEGTVTGIMHKVLNTEPPRPSSQSAAAPAALDAVVAKAMAKRPEDRFSTAAAFARELHAALDAAPAEPADDAEETLVAVRWPTPGRVTAVKMKPPRSALIAVCGLMAVAAGGAVTWYLTGQHAARQVAEAPSPSVAAVRPAPQEAPPAEPEQTETLAAPPPAAAETPPPAEALATSVPEPPARFGLAAARALALGVPCALLDVREAGPPGDSAHLQVSGPALPGTALDAFTRQLHAGDRSAEITTDRLDSRQCPAISAIADWVRSSREQNPLRLIVPAAPVAVGAGFPVRVPAVRDGALYVDLYAADGSVHHLLRGVVAGNTGSSDVAAVAPAPPGPGLLVAIASPTPLELSERPVKESATGYLETLQRELDRSGAAPRAEIAMLTITAAARPAPPTAATASIAPARPRPSGLNAARCADIVGRVQLGEALSDADRTVLQTSCGR